MNKKILTVVCAAWLFIVSACASPSEHTYEGEKYTADVIRVNYTLSYGSAQIQVMALRGMLEEVLPDNVRIEWSQLTQGVDIRDAMAAGMIDIAASGTTTIISAIENDYPIVILANGTIQSAELYSNNPEIRSIQDITADSRIAVLSLFTSSHVAFMIKCRDVFGDANKFSDNFVFMQYPEMFASLASSDELDCALFAFPHMKKTGTIPGLVKIEDLTPVTRENNLGTYLITTREFYDENPGLVKAFMEAFEDCTDYINANPHDAAVLLAEYYQDVESEDIAEEIIKTPLTYMISESAHDALASLMYEIEMLQNPPQKFADLPNYDSIPKMP